MGREAGEERGEGDSGAWGRPGPEAKLSVVGKNRANGRRRGRLRAPDTQLKPAKQIGALIGS